MGFDLEGFRELGLTEGEKHFRRLANTVEKGEQPPADTLQFLADAGRKILNGEDPKSALQLKKKKGNKPNGFKVIRHIEMVRIICMLMDEKHLTKNEAIERIATAAAAAAMKGYSIPSLERFYDAHHRSARERNRVEKLLAELIAQQQTPKI